MTVLTDSRYAGLAGSAAAALGSSSPDVVRAILSQWQCELGAQAPWPPPRNNPGNISRGLASELGLAYTVAPGPNPQPGNPIVTYPSASVGAQAYAAAIATHSRYAGALRAARAGDGLAFVRAIGSSGWGTGLSCMLGVYRGSGATGSGGNNGSSSPSPSSGSGTVLRLVSAKLASACSQVTVLAPSFSWQQVIPIPRANIGDPCTQCPQGWSPAVSDPGILRQIPFLGGSWVNPSDVPGQANSCVAPGVHEGDHFDANQAPGAAGSGLGSLLTIAIDPSSLVPVLVGGGVLVIAGALLLSGVSDMLGSGDRLEGA